MKRGIILIALCAVINCGTTNAQWLPVDSLHDYCWLCHNDQHLLGEPYNHTLKKEWPFLVTSGGILAAGLIMGATDNTKPYSPDALAGLDKNKINSFDRSTTNNWSPTAATISDFTLVGISLLPALFLSEHHTAHDFRSLTVMTLETFALNFGTTYIVKSTVNRTRPYVYNPNLSVSIRTDKQSRVSYYSGHTSQVAAATFLFAKVINDYHPDLKPGIKTGIWAFAITVPAVEAYFRVKGGKHYPTDVITGYVLGAFSGFIIPELHRNFAYREHKKTKLDVGLFPTNKGMGFSMNLTY